MKRRTPLAETEAYPLGIRADVEATASNLALLEWRAWIAAMVLLTSAFLSAILVRILIEILFSIEIGELGSGFLLAVVALPFVLLWCRAWRRLVKWMLIKRLDEVLGVHLALHPSSGRSAEPVAPSDAGKPSI